MVSLAVAGCRQVRPPAVVGRAIPVDPSLHIRVSSHRHFRRDFWRVLAVCRELEHQSVRILDVKRRAVSVFEDEWLVVRSEQALLDFLLSRLLDLQRDVNEKRLFSRSPACLLFRVGEVEKSQRAAIPQFIERVTEYNEFAIDQFMFQVHGREGYAENVLVEVTIRLVVFGGESIVVQAHR
jgi:hypothetical protein